MPRAVITYYDHIEQGSPEWLAARKDMYTGSNAYKLLNGIGDLEYAKAEESSFSGNFWTERGHLLEKQALEIYSRLYEVEVRETGFITNSLYPGCLYSPDGFTLKKLLEVKCFSRDRHLELVNARSTLDIPFKILAQIYYGMVITGLRVTELVAFNPLFAKKQIKDEFGRMIDNPDYDPNKAMRVIVIRHDREIAANFNRKLLGVPV